MALGLGAALSSCVYYPNPVPEMPYTPRRTPIKRQTEPERVVESVTESKPTPVAAPKPATPTMSSWAATSEPDPFPAPATQAPLPAPAPIATPKPTSAITQPTVATAPRPAPVLTPPPSPSPVPATTPGSITDKKLLLATDPGKITNDGPIPVATRVEGDPTRVYNPLDPSKTIRIIDRNGNVFPSGKELKVRGTNYHFYVP